MASRTLHVTKTEMSFKIIRLCISAIAAITLFPACAQQVDYDLTTFPETFVGTQENKIENAAVLANFFTKAKEKKSQARVLHIGDSHVRGNFFPGYVRKALEVTFGKEAMGEDPIGYNKPSIATETGKPGLVFSSIGINGATTRNFMKPEQLNAIKEQRPDLLIVSFGTNEGYDANYSAERHHGQLQGFLAALRETCGDSVAIILTTPPGCYKRGKTKDDKFENKNNSIVAQTIADFARENNLALWNIFQIAGDNNACSNWKNANYLQFDGVHFNTKGYELQGRLLGQAIARAAYEEDNEQ